MEPHHRAWKIIEAPERHGIERVLELSKLIGLGFCVIASSIWPSGWYRIVGDFELAAAPAWLGGGGLLYWFLWMGKDRLQAAGLQWKIPLATAVFPIFFGAVVGLVTILNGATDSSSAASYQGQIAEVQTSRFMGSRGLAVAYCLELRGVKPTSGRDYGLGRQIHDLCIPVTEEGEKPRKGSLFRFSAFPGTLGHPWIQPVD